MEGEQGVSESVLEELEKTKQIFSERLEAHDNNRMVVQETIDKICGRASNQVDDFEKKISTKLEEKYTAEENHLQTVFENLQMSESLDNPEDASEAIQKAKAELIVGQSYKVAKGKSGKLTEKKKTAGEGDHEKKSEQKQIFDLSSLCVFKTKKHLRDEMMSPMKPIDASKIKLAIGKVYIQLDYLNPHEMKVISEHKTWDLVRYECLIRKKDENEDRIKEYPSEIADGYITFSPDFLEIGSTYVVRVKRIYMGKDTELSEEVEFTPKDFNEYCAWRKCPESVVSKKYSVDEKSLNVSKNDRYDYCTIVGNMYIPPNAITSWSIKILKSKGNNGLFIFVGVAPFDIDQNNYNHNKCGWYFHCYYSSLHSGLPHNYEFKKYGPRKREGHYVHTGNSVGVTMDTTKGQLSFSLRGVNLGVAFEGIPLDKPLVPCVLLYNEGDSVEINPPKIKGAKADSPVTAPSNTTTERVALDPDYLRKELESATQTINDCLEENEDNKSLGQSRINEICGGIKIRIDELKSRLNSELEGKYNAEDERLQDALNELRSTTLTNDEEVSKAIQKAKAELLVEQSYEVIEEALFVGPKEIKVYERPDDENEDNEGNEEEDAFDFSSLCKLEVKQHFLTEAIDLRKPLHALVTKTCRGKVFLELNHHNPHETRVISEYNLWDQVKYKCYIHKKSASEDEGKEYPLKREDGCFTFMTDILEPGNSYEIRVKVALGEKESEWSEDSEFTTPESMEYCVWKKCHAYFEMHRSYFVNRENPRIATNIVGYTYCTIIGSTHIPLDRVNTWSIKILNSKHNDGNGILIGVAPSDIDQNEDANFIKCGWYFHCGDSSLYSGPPHHYRGKTYGPRKRKGEYVHTGDSVGVMMDTERGELSFVVDGIDLGVAYEGIPLDEPLVPCVILKKALDSVELVTLM